MTDRRFPSFFARILPVMITALLMIGSQPVFAGKKKKKKIHQASDKFSEGFQPDGMHIARTMGSIGILGQKRNGPKDRDNREIRVNTVLEGSPADGTLKVADVILGIVEPKIDGKTGGGTFTMDPSDALIHAILEAEKKDTPNHIVLKVWRPETYEAMGYETWWREQNNIATLITYVKKPIKAETIEVTLPIKPLGDFSATSPWNCERTDTMINMTAELIAGNGFDKVSEKNFSWALDALGLLATGEKKYHPVVKQASEIASKEVIDLDIHGEKGMGTWRSAYLLIFLTEYHLATNDKDVLPAITNCARYIAQGVSGVGTWSHGMAQVKKNGMYGPPTAYGAMNQVSLAAGIGLLMAKKCGVNDPHVEKALKLCTGFYTQFIDRGCISYGDHGPIQEKYDSNGRMSIAAHFFNLMGNKRGADYCTRMTLLSHRNRYYGHAGHFFSIHWGPLAAGLGGPKAVQAFTKSTRLYTELARRHDGSQMYQAWKKPDSFSSWSSSGSRLLQYCLPRKALYITGKGKNLVPPLSQDEVDELMAAAALSVKEFTTEQLLKRLSHFAPAVRLNAAEELGMREDDVVDELIAMLKSEDRYTRYGATTGLRCAGRGSAKAKAALFDIITTSDDWTFRMFALSAFGGNPKGFKGEHTLGKVPLQYANALMKLALVQDSQNDPYEKMGDSIAGVLKHSLSGKKGLDGALLENVDRKTFIPFIQQMLQHTHSATRGGIAEYLHFFSKKELEPMWGPLYFAMTRPAPSGVMSGGAVNMQGNAIMARHHIKEGLPLAIWFIIDKKAWGNEARRKSIHTIIPYGMHLEPRFYWFERWQGSISVKRSYPTFKATPAPKLVSIQTYIDAYEANLSDIDKQRRKIDLTETEKTTAEYAAKMKADPDFLAKYRKEVAEKKAKKKAAKAAEAKERQEKLAAKEAERKKASAENKTGAE